MSLHDAISFEEHTSLEFNIKTLTKIELIISFNAKFC